ncbi:hypothetical protein FB451DRAFT_427915 [Mycena latifolia]|nr:hypothetical protein FB451DRAFT_427915 [Mycena latifolia]
MFPILFLFFAFPAFAAAAPASALVAPSVGLADAIASTGIGNSPVVAAGMVAHSIDLAEVVASTAAVPATTTGLVTHNINLAEAIACTGIGNSPVVAAHTRGFVPEPSNTTGPLSVWEQSSPSPHPTTFPVPVVKHIGSGGSPSHPTNVRISELSNTTAEESTTPDNVPVFGSGNGLPVSPKVIFGIIFAFSLFVAVNIALFCLWNKRFCRSRSPDVPPSRCPHVDMTVSCALTCPRPANPRPLSCETMVGRASDAKDDDSV